MKKTGVFDKAKRKSGVVEGGIKELEKVIKNGEKDNFKDWSGPMVRLCIMVPETLRMAYRSRLMGVGKTVQDDLSEYVLHTMSKK